MEGVRKAAGASVAPVDRPSATIGWEDDYEGSHTKETFKNCGRERAQDEGGTVNPIASRSKGRTDKQQTVTAEKVLEHFHEQFITDVEAKKVVLELFRKDVISDGDVKEITSSEDRTLQNQTLHKILKEKCTDEALETVCDVIVAVKGNPKMKALGEAMKRALKAGDTSSSTTLAEALVDKQRSAMNGQSFPFKGSPISKGGHSGSKEGDTSTPTTPAETHVDRQRSAMSGRSLQSEGSQISRGGDLSSKEGEESGKSCGRCKTISPALMILLVAAIIFFLLGMLMLINAYANQAGNEMFAEQFQDSQHHTSPNTAAECQDLTSCPTSSTVWPSAHYVMSGSKNKQDQVLQKTPLGTHGITTFKLPWHMPTEVTVISCVLLHNKVYISGIATENVQESRQVQVYSLEENIWSKLPEAPNHNAPIAIVNDRITLIGGLDAKTDEPSSVVSTWFEEEERWEQILHSMPTRLVASAAYNRGNILLVTGGAEKSTNGGENYTVVEKVHVYNFSTMKWTTPQSLQLPKALRSHHLVQFGAYIYLAGGAYTFLNEADTASKDQVYNSNAWRARWADIEEAVQQELEESVWKPIADLPAVGSTIVLCGHSIISVGGEKDRTPLKAIYEFKDEKVDNPWVWVGNMSEGRFRHGVVALGTHGAALFVAGGRTWSWHDETTVKSKSVELVLL